MLIFFYPGTESSHLTFSLSSVMCQYATQMFSTACGLRLDSDYASDIEILCVVGPGYLVLWFPCDNWITPNLAMDTCVERQVKSEWTGLVLSLPMFSSKNLICINGINFVDHSQTRQHNPRSEEEDMLWSSYAPAVLSRDNMVRGNLRQSSSALRW